jgi:hypothetical protein
MFNRLFKRKDQLPSVDQPVNFGYKTAWLAVRSTDPEIVKRGLGLKKGKPANWSQGIKAAYQGKLFITPPLADWTLVVGEDLPDSTDKHVLDLLASWSQTFGECQLFRTHRVVDLHSWARASAGAIQRVFCWAGESQEVLIDQGRPTEIEQEIGFSSQGKFASPTEDLVMRIAADWSLNPTQIEHDFAETRGLGWMVKPVNFG